MSQNRNRKPTPRAPRPAPLPERVETRECEHGPQCPGSGPDCYPVEPTTLPDLPEARGYDAVPPQGVHEPVTPRGRDVRWENVYASISPSAVDPYSAVTFLTLKVEVTFAGMTYDARLAVSNRDPRDLLEALGYVVQHIDGQLQRVAEQPDPRIMRS